MSFMFNPFPYDDMTALNQITISDSAEQSLVVGNSNIYSKLAELCKSGVTALEGYVGIGFEEIVCELQNICPQTRFINIEQYYKSGKELDVMFSEILPHDPKIDPVSLFGRIFEGTISDLMNKEKLTSLITEIQTNKTAIVLYGCGSACRELRDLIQTIIYCDITPQHVVLRAKAGLVQCIGDETSRPFKALMRRIYYVDYEVCIRLRQELLNEEKIAYYLDCNESDNLKMVSRAALDEIFQALVERPFRCKPCYLEGVWGGDYIKQLRSLPENMRNCAWVFDLIPNEVSLLAKIHDVVLEFPFVTFFRKMGVPLMGKHCVDTYKGLFPIRFNYDDNYHGGNMSIQIHPPREYIKNHFGEPFQQDESYYVVFTAGSRTYLGLKDGNRAQEFFAAVQKSEQDGTPVDYEQYVNSVVSRQGRQFLIPAGTIHSSGENQVVLEIGSCTLGSYTFKLYDYLRIDLDGTRRPIHSQHGMNVLDPMRREEYVKEKLVPVRKLIREGKDWAEYIIGEHDKIFFQLRCLEFYQSIECDTEENFHVLNLVEGQRVRIESIAHPERNYEIGYLEMAVVPACIGKYRIVNLGAGPVTVHKTLLKPE